MLKIRDEYRQIQWVVAIQECKASILTNKEYCTQHGLFEKSFCYWKKKLRTQIVDAVSEMVSLKKEPFLSSFAIVSLIRKFIVM